MNQKDLTVVEDVSRFALLEKLENNIQMAYRRGLDAARSMGTDFAQIKEQELYRERGYETFYRYINDYSELSHQSVDRLITVSKTAQLLEGAGLRVPASEAQMIELARLQPQRQISIWKLVVESLPLEEITAKVVRIAVDQEEKRSAPKLRSGVKTDLDMNNDQEQSEDQEQDEQTTTTTTVTTSRTFLKGADRPIFSQEAEVALDRIGSICGDQTAEAIASGTVPISDRDLIRWAEQSDIGVRNLAHYIVDERWSLRKAIEFEDRIIDNETTVGQLLSLARARGGKAIAELQDYNEEFAITVERTRFIR